MSKPKLELQFNIPQTIKFLQSQPATGSNNYGQWFLYNVSCGEKEYSYFAPEKVVEFLKEKNLVEGNEVIITKKLIRKGNKNITDYSIDILDRNSSDNDLKNTHAWNNGNGNGNGKVINGHSKSEITNGNENGYNKDYKIMLQCLTDAQMIRDELGIDIDVNKIGITLYLRKVKP